MTNIDGEYLLRKPRLRQSFLPLQMETDDQNINIEKSVWTWLRTFIKPRGQRSDPQAIYTKIRDKCYYTKNIQKEESFWKQIWSSLDKKFLVYQPEHPLLLVWYFLMLCILYLHFIQIPLALFFWQIVFVDEFSTTWSLVFNYLSIFMLIVDIFLRFNIAYYQHGLIVLKRESIVKRYISWRLEVDLLCLIILMVYVFMDQNWLIYLKIVFYLKIYQTVEYDHSIQSALELNLLFISIYKLLRIIGIFVLYSHIMACGFFYLDYYLYTNNQYYLQNGLLWLTNSSALPLNMIENYNWYIWYQYAMYWALQTATTVGYGDITPKNPQQVIYVIINMIFMCVIFGYFINSIWQIIGDWSDKSKRYKQNFSNFNRYLKNKSISQGLQQKLRAYLDYLWRQDTIEDIQSTIVSKLTPGLRDELTLNIKYPFFLKLRFFNLLQNSNNKKNHGEFKKALANQIKEERYSQDETIYKQKQINNRLFYILEGKVEIRIRNFAAYILMAQNFGQYEFITEQPHYSSAVTVKYSYLYLLQKCTFMQHLKLYADLYQSYLETRDRILTDLDLSRTSISCHFCFQKHLVTRCEDLTYIAKPRQDVEGYVQNRKRFDREDRRLKIVGRYAEDVLILQNNDFEEGFAQYQNYNPKYNISRIKAR